MAKTARADVPAAKLPWTGEVTNDEGRARYKRALEAFDTITGASYYGMNFRQILMQDPEAMRAAEALADALRANGGPGID